MSEKCTLQSNENNTTKIVSLNGVQISVDRMMTKDYKHRVLYAVCGVANGSQWHSFLSVGGCGDQWPTSTGNIKTPQFVHYNAFSNSAIDVDVVLKWCNILTYHPQYNDNCRIRLLPPPRRLCKPGVCLPVCLCLLVTLRKTSERIFVKILSQMYLSTRKNWLNFGSHLPPDRDPGIF